jgi:TRAP-type C4-dicarboxylate transport system permease small subunit
MDVRQRYARAMEWIYIGCIVLSGGAMVVITLIIPLGVFMRYAMNQPLSWPEPAAVVMMVMFSFLGGAAVYRANVHIAVEALLNAVRPAPPSCSATACTCARSRGTRRWPSFPASSRGSSTCRSRLPVC